MTFYPSWVRPHPAIVVDAATFTGSTSFRRAPQLREWCKTALQRREWCINALPAEDARGIPSRGLNTRPYLRRVWLGRLSEHRNFQRVETDTTDLKRLLVERFDVERGALTLLVLVADLLPDALPHLV